MTEAGYCLATDRVRLSIALGILREISPLCWPGPDPRGIRKNAGLQIRAAIRNLAEWEEALFGVMKDKKNDHHYHFEQERKPDGKETNSRGQSSPSEGEGGNTEGDH